ncbi:hypothetical protein OPQ81_008595 [Rhizoctonia solani]|nr:hypothetical protein OPQ81_008595 [Rhizoctonia solani]
MGSKQSSARVRNIIKAWLKATWGYNDFVSEEMPCGTQLDDITLCGVCAVNTIERQVFGDLLWVEEFALAYRASKFVEVVHRVLRLNGYTATINPPLNISRVLMDSTPGLIEQELSIKLRDRQHTPNPPTSGLPSEPSNDDFLNDVSSDAPDNVELDALTDNEATTNPEPVHQNFAWIEPNSDSGSGSGSDSGTSSSSGSVKRPKKRQRPGKSTVHTRTTLEAIRKGNFKIDDS